MILEKVLNTKSIKWISNLGEKTNNQTIPWKWLTIIVGFLMMLFFIGWTLYRSYKKSNEIAKLKHEKDVALEKKHQIRLKKRLDKNNEKLVKNNLKLEELNSKIENIDYKLDNVFTERLIEEEKIIAFKNWKDLDNYINNYPTN